MKNKDTKQKAKRTQIKNEKKNRKQKWGLSLSHLYMVVSAKRAT